MWELQPKDKQFKSATKSIKFNVQGKKTGIQSATAQNRHPLPAAINKILKLTNTKFNHD